MLRKQETLAKENKDRGTRKETQKKGIQMLINKEKMEIEKKRKREEIEKEDEEEKARHLKRLIETEVKKGLAKEIKQRKELEERIQTMTKRIEELEGERKRERASEENEHKEKEKGGKRIKEGREETIKKERLKLEKIKGEAVKEAEVRQFVSKINEKIRNEEAPQDITKDMINALGGIVYDVFERAKGDKAMTTYEEIRTVVEEIKRSCIKRKSGAEIIEELQKEGKAEDRGARMWAQRIEMRLKEAEEKEMDNEYNKIEIFIEGMHNDKLRRWVRKNRSMLKTLQEAVKVAEDRESYYK
jgi:hypothetical protein